MLPSLRNRLVIAFAAAVGAWAWLSVGGHLRAADGSTGLSLMTAQHGPGRAVLLMLLAGLPALLAGGLASALGNPLSGVFATAVALSVLTAWSGGIQGWLFRDGARLPHDYLGLIFEMIIWTVCILGMLWSVRFVGVVARSLVPSGSLNAGTVKSGSSTSRLKSCAAAAVCSIISGALAVMLLRNPDIGQVICSLILAFFVGGLVATSIWPNSHPWAILLSPALVAIAAYGWVIMSFPTASEFLHAWNHFGDSALRLPGPAVAMPAHYASAAIMGCTLGIGWAQSMNRSRSRSSEHQHRE